MFGVEIRHTGKARNYLLMPQEKFLNGFEERIRSTNKTSPKVAKWFNSFVQTLAKVFFALQWTRAVRRQSQKHF